MPAVTEIEKELTEVFLKVLNSDKHIVIALDPEAGELILSRDGMPAEDALMMIENIIWKADG